MPKIIKTIAFMACGLPLLWAPHALAKAKSKTQLEVQVTPATAMLFVDGKPQGKVGKDRVIDITPGTHTVKLTSKGDEHEERVKFAANQKTTYTFEFDEGTPSNAGTGGSPVPDPATDDTPAPAQPDTPPAQP